MTFQITPTLSIQVPDSIKIEIRLTRKQKDIMRQASRSSGYTSCPDNVYCRPLVKAGYLEYEVTHFSRGNYRLTEAGKEYLAKL